MTSTEVYTTDPERYGELVLIGVLPGIAGGDGRPALAAPARAAQLPATLSSLLLVFTVQVFVYEQQSSLYHARASWDPMQKGRRGLHLLTIFLVSGMDFGRI
jgi:hypothetical protein